MLHDRRAEELARDIALSTKAVCVAVRTAVDEAFPGEHITPAQKQAAYQFGASLAIATIVTVFEVTPTQVATGVALLAQGDPTLTAALGRLVVETADDE